MPTSTGLESAKPGLLGTVDGSHVVHGQLAGGPAPIVTVMPAPGVSRFAQSSAARTRMFAEPGTAGVHANVQFVVPVAAAHVAPPSTETSTWRTLPPPTSAEVPFTVIIVPVGYAPPSTGKPIVDAGGETSPVAVAETNPACIVVGCTPISANRFSVACCIRSTAGSWPRSWSLSNPHDHCTVPAPNTSAPLVCR